jgi:hypothetical protein
MVVDDGAAARSLSSMPDGVDFDGFGVGGWETTIIVGLNITTTVRPSSTGC